MDAKLRAQLFALIIAVSPEPGIEKEMSAEETAVQVVVRLSNRYSESPAHEAEPLRRAADAAEAIYYYLVGDIEAGNEAAEAALSSKELTHANRSAPVPVG